MSTTDAAERLLNLVIALMNTPGRMTKEQIRAGVVGYDDASDESFERKFERDKDTLRELGIPVVTVDDSGHATEIGYRIDTDAYALAPLPLDAAELAVLGLAAQLWQDRVLRTDTGRALTKLTAASGTGAHTDALAALAPRVRAAGGAYGPLLEAILARRAVRFTYRAANTGVRSSRHVQPWRLAVRGGGWYLIGHDEERSAVRAFRLSRIEGTPRAVGSPGAVTIPADVDVDAALGRRHAEVRRAVLAVVPERAEALRARSRPAVADDRAAPDDPPLPLPPARLAGRDLVAVDFDDVTRAAEEVAAYGDVVAVLEPADLRDAVIETLRAAAAVGEEAHHG